MSCFQPTQLCRCLTQDKIELAYELLDRKQAETGVHSNCYLINMHLLGGDSDNDDDNASVWYVHYIKVYNDGSRLYEQNSFVGSYNKVRQMFVSLV